MKKQLEILKEYGFGNENKLNIHPLILDDNAAKNYSGPVQPLYRPNFTCLHSILYLWVVCFPTD